MLYQDPKITMLDSYSILNSSTWFMDLPEWGLILFHSRPITTYFPSFKSSLFILCCLSSSIPGPLSPKDEWEIQDVIALQIF